MLEEAREINPLPRLRVVRQGVGEDVDAFVNTRLVANET